MLRLLPCSHAGIEPVVADTARAFGRHTHERFGIGLVERGAQTSASGRGRVQAQAGDIITVNPGEVHDGLPVDEAGRAWRMLYLVPELVDGGFEFHDPVLRDTRLATLFRRLFRTLVGPAPEALAIEQDLTLLLAPALLRASLRSAPAAIARARQRIDDDPAAAPTLDELAREAGLSRWQLLRGFADATGLTPHAYLIQRRLQQARALIAAGQSLADAATASGFADQSHLTRLFVRSYGFAPGAYALQFRSRPGR